MDLNSLKEFVNNHPEGVRIRMVDGAVYVIPHRDFIWFTPAYGQPESRFGRYATSFYLHDRDGTKLVNALLVAQVSPLRRNGSNGRKRRRRSA